MSRPTGEKKYGWMSSSGRGAEQQSCSSGGIITSAAMAAWGFVGCYTGNEQLQLTVEPTAVCVCVGGVWKFD